jgi:predicted PurR-regulated permease PerM
VKYQRAQARWIAVLVAIAIALYLCWLMLRPFVGVLEWATVLVIVFYPIHRRLAKRIKRPSLSAFLSCLLVILIVILPFTFLTVALADELTKIVPNLPVQISQLLNTQTPVVGKVSKWIQGRLGTDTLASQEFMIEQLKRSGEYLLGLSLGLMGNILGGIVKAFFVIFTMYYLFRDGEPILNNLRGVLPLTKSQSERIFVRTREVVSASVYGVVTIAMIQGLLGGLAFWLLGVPSPILWAVLMTFVCMIPVAGSFMVWVPLSLYLMLNGHWTKAILLLVWGTLVVSTVDNFLRPKLIKNQTKLHELFVFFSVLGGMSVFGILGIVLGPVVLAITLGLLDTLRHGEEDLPYKKSINYSNEKIDKSSRKAASLIEA